MSAVSRKRKINAMGIDIALSEIFRELNAADSILLLTHLRPDGDALGSTFGLREFLRSRGKRADVLLTDGMPHRYIKMYRGALTDLTREDAESYALIAVLDCANIQSLNLPSQLGIDFLRTRRTINLDHHAFNNIDAPENCLCTSASSASEIVAGMLIDSGADIPTESATALLAGIMTDTGCFRFSNTGGKTLRTAGTLLDHGARLEFIANNVFFSKPLNCASFEADLISTRLRLACGGKFAYAYIDDELLKKHSFTLSEDEGVIDTLREIEGVVIAMLAFRNAKGEFKLSLRSKEHDFPVGPLARKFGGGGHEMAAGATIRAENFSEVETLILDEITLLLGD